MTLPFRHKIRYSSPGGLRPSTLPPGHCHGGSPQYWIFTSEWGSNILFLWNLEVRVGFEPAIHLNHCSFTTTWISYVACILRLNRGPRVVVSTAAFHARVRGSVPGLGGLKNTKMFLPHPGVKFSIVGSLRDREVACSASDRQGSNFESCVWRTVSSQSSDHPQEVLLAQFSLYVHKGGLKPDSFHFILYPTIIPKTSHCLSVVLMLGRRHADPIVKYGVSCSCNISSWFYCMV